MKIAIIGVGNMGKNHLRLFSQIPGVTVLAIADLNTTTGTALAKKFNCKYYKSYKDLLKKESIEAVSICVPTMYHSEVASFFLQKGIHTFVEKPITNTVGDAKKLLKVAKKKNLVFLVGHVERFNPAVIKLKEMIDKGELGKVTSIITRRVGGFPPQIQDVNIAVDLAIHDIDIVNYLLGEYPSHISVNKQKHHIKRREDSVEFFLRYKKASAYIQANWISPVKIRKLNITGTEGYLEMDYISQRIEFYKSNYSKFKNSSKDYSDYILKFSEPDRINISVARKEPLKEELQYFTDAVHKKLKTDSTYAVEALKIALQENVK